MSALKDAAERLAKLGRHPVPYADRRLECEKAVARLEGREASAAREKEPWDDFLRRIGVIEA